METKNVIFELRTQKGLSQEELAQKCGVSRQTINAIEKGDYKAQDFLTELKEMTAGVVKDVKANKAGMLCPVCRQGHVIRGNTRYGCSRWREGCTYAEPF